MLAPPCPRCGAAANDDMITRRSPPNCHPDWVGAWWCRGDPPGTCLTHFYAPEPAARRALRQLIAAVGAAAILVIACHRRTRETT